MTIALVTAAASDPVTTAEAKTHMRIDFSTDDTYIEGLITAATDWVQWRSGRQLVSATFRQSWDSYPTVIYPSKNDWLQSGARIWQPGMETAFVPLARGPVSSVSWVKYYDADDVQQTVSSSDYWVDTDSDPARVVPKNGWPTIYLGRPNAFQVQFVAGYGNAAAVPKLLKQAVLWLVAHWYENREAVVMNQYAREVPMGVESACMRYSSGELP